MGRLEERDLRSLERPSMYSIFAPLEAEAPRPRPGSRKRFTPFLWLRIDDDSPWMDDAGYLRLSIFSLTHRKT